MADADPELPGPGPLAQGQGERDEGTATEVQTERARFTVDFRAIEIDFQEAVSRFLNVPGKSGRQSVNFYSKCAREIQRVSIDWLPDCAR